MTAFSAGLPARGVAIAALTMGILVEAVFAAPPNIVFIFSDDHALQAIGAYGSKLNRTPSLDRLAADGMRFDRCMVVNSICGPSRASLLTGKHSHKNGFYRNNNVFDGSQPTLQSYLRQAGYQTALIGKWHLGSEPTGFDHWSILIGQGPYYNPTMIENGEKKQHTGYTTEIITDQALAWLKSGRDEKRPFLLMYQHKAPHRDWQPGPGYFDMYEEADLPEPATLFTDHSGKGFPARVADTTIAQTLTARDLKLLPPEGLTPAQLDAWNAAYEPRNEAFRKAGLQGDALVRWKYQRYVKDYLRCVAAMDDQIGRVLDYLEQSGLADNTIVIYSSDQGYFLGEHGWFDKRWIYRESVQTPLIIRWPGVTKPDSVCDEIVGLIDIAPTLLEVAGVPTPPDMQGRSLVPLLRGRKPADWRTGWYYHFYEHPGSHNVHRHYGIVTKDFTLAHFYEPEVNAWEMYDHRKDPDHRRSVHDDPAYVEQRNALEAQLRQLQEELEVPPVDPPDSWPGFRLDDITSRYE